LRYRVNLNCCFKIFTFQPTKHKNSAKTTPGTCCLQQNRDGNYINTQTNTKSSRTVSCRLPSGINEQQTEKRLKSQSSRYMDITFGINLLTTNNTIRNEASSPNVTPVP